MSERTPELEERVKAFLNAYQVLVNEHMIDFATYPVFVPDGNGSFKIVMQNTPVDMTGKLKDDVIVDSAK